jgi:PAS domain S-box-containing protein
LRTALSICLDSRFPIVIFWGPDLVQFYNDAYAAAILRDKHPALGVRAQVCWREIWPVIGPLLDTVVNDGRATYSEDLYLPVITNGAAQERYFTFSYSPIRTEGGIGGVFCAVTETTERILREREAAERAEALAELDRAKTSFFSNISHEFRTPLTLMLGPLDELMQSAGETQFPLVQMARRNALRLLKLVNTLLQFSRLEAERLEASFVKTDLAALTADLVGAFRSAIESAGLKLITDIELSQPVFVDRSMWERIVLNLLSNALKFTFEGAIRIELRERYGEAELIVSDTGVGIPEAELPHIFERFRRVRNTRARSYEGSGIGLALVDELVRRHGGLIRVESRLGAGTIFHVLLQFGCRHLPEAQVELDRDDNYISNVSQYLADIEATIDVPDTRPPSTKKAVARAGARILLVDDNRDLRDYVSRVLSPNYVVVEASNGEEALIALRAAQFDLLISDVMMPEMDGVELLRAIREDEGLQTLPVIFLSARAGEESTIEGLLLGANDYLVKPFVSDELVARVEAQLIASERHRAREEALSQSEREFRRLADTIPVIVWTADSVGRFEWCNERWYEYTGLEPADATGWKWQAAHHPDELAAVMREWPHSVATGEPFEMEFRLRRADGEYRAFLTRAIPVHDETGTIQGWYGSSIDIHAQHEAFEHTRRVAETLERVHLPSRLPHTSKLRIDAAYQPAVRDALVGGDWFDAVELPDGRHLLSIGDVAGHGLQASIIAGRLRQAIVDFALENADPSTVLQCANRILRFQHPDVFATALVAFIDPACTQLTYASAGHQAPLLAQDPAVPALVLPIGGLALGIEDEIQLQPHTVPIRTNAIVAFYTDGITEFARDIASAEKRLRSAVSQLVGSAVARPAVAVRDAVLVGGETIDDAVVLIAQFAEISTEEIKDGSELRKTWRFHSSDARTACACRVDIVKFLRRFTSDRGQLLVSETIIGEILANTVEHAPSVVDVCLDWTGENPVMTVEDEGPGLKTISSELPVGLTEGGRGLFLIQTLAHDVQTSSSSGGGARLRVVLPLERFPKLVSAGETVA